MVIGNKTKIKIVSFIIGSIFGSLLSFICGIFFINYQYQYFTDSKYAIMENGFCYYQPIKKYDITYDLLNEQSLSQQCGGQSRVDVCAFQDTDVQEKVIVKVYNDVKNIKSIQSDDNDIWVTSDIHGDVKMLLQGLLLSGLIKWDGSLKREYYQAYRNRILEVVYPDIEINKNFKGVYINLGDIVNKNAFGITSLYLLHDIYEKTKQQNGTNDVIKIIAGNHEYYDLQPQAISAYKETLLKFADMFDVFYEKDGLSFTHAPITAGLKPKNKQDAEYLKTLLVKDDENFRLKHLLYGYEGVGDFPTYKSPEKPKLILSKNVSGHTHGNVDFGYNKRKDVLNIATDRFAKDVSKRGIIFRINTKEKSVYSYTPSSDGNAIENRFGKNLFA